MSAAPAGTAATPRPTGARLMLLAILGVCLLPLGAALFFRFVAPPQVKTLAGTPLAPRPFPAAAVRQRDGAAFTMPGVGSQWLLVHAGSGNCDAACRAALYLTRQARTAQGRAQVRLQRIWILTDPITPEPELLAAHPDLLLLSASDAEAVAPLAADSAIHLADRRGYLVFRYAANVEPAAFIKELGKLVKF